jgi:hypothetical protein
MGLQGGNLRFKQTSLDNTMSTQIITVLKIAGACSKHIVERVQRFRMRQKKSTDQDSIISTDHWTPSCRREIDTFAENIRRHARKPPIVFFAEYVDMWSIASPWLLFPAWQQNGIQLLGDKYGLEC